MTCSQQFASIKQKHISHIMLHVRRELSMDTPRNRLLRKLRENQIRQKLEFEDSSKLAQLFPCNGATVDSFATDVVFGFHKPCGDASMQNENNWGFQVKEDGSVIYQQGNHQETYHVPHEAIDRLSKTFRPFYEMSFPDFVLNTGIQGLVEWCNILASV